MDPITAMMLASVASNLVGGLSANSTAQDNLAFQKEQAYNQDRFSKAGTTDALGNTNRYDEALNQWISQLSPTQQRIAKAGEHEQLANLLQDAPQNRIMRQNAYERSKSGADAYNDEFANYRFNRPQSEGSIDNELVGLMARARGSNGQGTTSNETLRNHGKVAVVRSGSPTGGNGSVDDLAQIMLDARKGALAEKGQRDNQFEQTGRSRLGAFGAIANGGTPAQLNTSNMSGGLTSQQDRMMGARAQALQNVSQNVGGAYNNLDKVQLQAGKNIGSAFTTVPRTQRPGTNKYGVEPGTGYGPGDSSYDEDGGFNAFNLY